MTDIMFLAKKESNVRSPLPPGLRREAGEGNSGQHAKKSSVTVAHCYVDTGWQDVDGYKICELSCREPCRLAALHAHDHNDVAE
ncbi:hypothetical protein BH10BAC6_BH10BAC6_05730 [soil metagenome]